MGRASKDKIRFMGKMNECPKALKKPDRLHPLQKHSLLCSVYDRASNGWWTLQDAKGWIRLDYTLKWKENGIGMLDL